MSEFSTPPGVVISGECRDRYDEVLTHDALAFLAHLQRQFASTRAAAIERRAARQDELDAGATLDFLDETAYVRDADWTIAPPAPGLVDRRAEITGPTDRRMAINALNSGAKVWMADFEDANTPSWDNLVQGQLNLRDAIDGRIDFVTEDGRPYALSDDPATIVVRPRGWHLVEKHVLVDGEPMSGSLFDFGCYVLGCVDPARVRSQPPYFYLPKTESHLEARLWDEIFTNAESTFGLERGTIRATVLIETIVAAFEMDEILYELKDHAAGLNAGRWDYLFSLIKKFSHQGGAYVLPDRNAVTMAAPFMRAYTELLVKTCHRRGAHAIGGMAAFIPSRRDAAVNAIALAKVREDKEREVAAGFDGSWVAHPDLVPVCTSVFDAVLGSRPNQLDRQRDDVAIEAGDLLDLASTPGEITEAGLRNDVSVGLQYLAAWLRGSGAVAIFNLMEDVATAEIARSQVWQWLRNEIVLPSDVVIDEALVRHVIDEELDKIATEQGATFDADAFGRARDLFSELVFSPHFAEFLTLSAYSQIP